MQIIYSSSKNSGVGINVKRSQGKPLDVNVQNYKIIDLMYLPQDAY